MAQRLVFAWVVALGVCTNLNVSWGASEPGSLQALAALSGGCSFCTGDVLGAAPNPLLQPVYGYFQGQNGSVWDFRLTIKPSQLGPLRAVGQLRLVGEDPVTKRTYTYGGTATLISSCHILTSAHAMIDENHGNQLWKKMDFLIGDEQKSVAVKRISNQIGISQHISKTCTIDYEVLRVYPCVGDEYGFLPILNAPANQLRDQFLMSVGYPGNRDSSRGLTIDPVCTLSGPLEIKKTGLVETRTDCSTDGGDSGGPILTREEFPSIIAIKCAAGGGNHKKNVPFVQQSEDIENGIFNIVTTSESFYSEVARVLSRPEEQAYIRSLSRNAPPVFGLSGSSGGPWQRPGGGAPPMPVLTRKKNTMPPGWQPVDK